MLRASFKELYAVLDTVMIRRFKKDRGLALIVDSACLSGAAVKDGGFAGICSSLHCRQ